jgi:glycosyltransferase involved in cell wall biosynthesis
MHILIIPGEQLNPDDQYSSIFEIHQARALKLSGLKCGFIATKISSKGLDKGLGKIFKRVLNLNFFYIHTISSFCVVEYIGFFASRIFKRNKYKMHINLGMSAYEKYIQHEGKPDVIHAHSRFLIGGLIAHAINKKYKIPYVITEHSTYYARQLVAKKELKLMYEVIKNAGAWITVSPELGNLVTGLLPYSLNKKFIYIPNVIDPSFEMQTIRANKNKQPFVFINIATLDSKKSQDKLIKAFALAFTGNFNVQLNIAGDGPLKDYLLSVAKKSGIESQVKFLGQLNRSEVLNELQHSNVFVLSSTYETFGVVLIEALACGNPVISTRSGGPENIVNDLNGILVEPGDIIALADSMKRMISDYETYDPQSIKSDCINRFGSVKFSDSMKLIYTSMLN